MANTEAPAQCRRCKRHNLRTPASRALGIGPRCAAIEAATGQCSCKWGARRISATTKTCWHVAAVLLDMTPRRAATRRQFVLSA